MFGRSGSLDTSTVDLSFFKGATLVQICLGSNDLGLNFDIPSIPDHDAVGIRHEGLRVRKEFFTT